MGMSFVFRSFWQGILLLGISLFVSEVSYGAVGDWEVWPNTSVIYSMGVLENNLFLATSGGVVKIDSQRVVRKIYTSREGLQGAEQQEIIVTEDGNLWVLDKNGVIARYDATQDKFQTVHTSYRSSGSVLLQGLWLAEGSILVLGFNNKLGLFSVDETRSLMSLDRIGGISLGGGNSVSALAYRKDTLFVAVGNRVFQRYTPTKDLARDLTLPNPDTWNELEPEADSVVIRNLWWQGDSLIRSPWAGKASMDSSKPLQVLQEPGSLLVLYGDTLEIPELYSGGEPGSASAVPSVIHVAGSEDRVWLAKSNFLYYWDGSALPPVEYNIRWRISPVHNVVLRDDGGVIAWAGDFVGILENEAAYYSYLQPNAFDKLRSLERSYKSVAIDQEGGLFIGTWGVGALSKPLGSRVDQIGTPWNWWGFNTDQRQNDCIGSYLNDGFTIIQGAVSTPEIPGVLFTYWGNSSAAEGYGFGYLTPEGQLSCVADAGSASLGGTLLTMPDTTANSAEGSVLLYSVASDQIVDATSNWVDVWRLSPRAGEGFPWSLELIDSVSTDALGYVRDMTLDRHGRIWMMGLAQVGVLTTDTVWDGNTAYLQDTLLLPDNEVMPPADNFFAIEQGGGDDIWLGSVGEGLFRMTATKNLDDLSWEVFDVRSGMLSDNVYDIAVNQHTGEIWVANGVGLSRYESRSRDASLFQTDAAPEVKVYPVPFQPGKDPHLIFDHIANTGSLRIFDSSGNIIGVFSGQELKGGMFLWDGLNQNGATVKAGVYYYSVYGAAEPAKPVKGKFIVLR